MKYGKYWMLGLLMLAGCGRDPAEGLPADAEIDYCAGQAERTLAAVTDRRQIPNAVAPGSDQWIFVRPGGWWTCGFWPGELWYLYEGTGRQVFREEAERVSRELIEVAYRRADSHDVGFMMMTSLGNAYRLTGERVYADALLAAADSLAALYNPQAGTILSWPWAVEPMGWPHNTIIDNMLNLELLFWAAEHGGDPRLRDIAVSHAETTRRNHFREDGSAFHVAVYDAEDGHFLRGVTRQGWKDGSMWARGQAWAIYGFTMAYRYTREVRFLETAERALEAYLSRLPEDRIPYWDFQAGEELPDQPKDASAAAVTASALLELGEYVPARRKRCRQEAVEILRTLSAPPYRAGKVCSAFLLHSVGDKPGGSEVDYSLSYADYYYIEALVRLKRLQAGQDVPGNEF